MSAEHGSKIDILGKAFGKIQLAVELNYIN